MVSAGLPQGRRLNPTKFNYFRVVELQSLRIKQQALRDARTNPGLCGLQLKETCNGVTVLQTNKPQEIIVQVHITPARGVNLC